ncbi:MAG: hypothetical protein H7A37_02110 [Chlamydiales bacterium]|nr:hypothetical protein [Chlamydiales bacterium]
MAICNTTAPTCTCHPYMRIVETYNTQSNAMPIRIFTSVNHSDEEYQAIGKFISDHRNGHTVLVEGCVIEHGPIQVKDIKQHVIVKSWEPSVYLDHQKYFTDVIYGTYFETIKKFKPNPYENAIEKFSGNSWRVLKDQNKESKEYQNASKELKKIYDVYSSKFYNHMIHPFPSREMTCEKYQESLSFLEDCLEKFIHELGYFHHETRQSSLVSAIQNSYTKLDVLAGRYHVILPEPNNGLSDIPLEIIKRGIEIFNQGMTDIQRPVAIYELTEVDQP